MALGKLTPYFNRQGKRIDYVFVDTQGRFVVSAERNGKRKRKLCDSISQARYYASNIDLLFGGGEKPQEVELLSDLIAKYRTEWELHHSAPATVEAQCRNLIRHLGDISIERISPALAAVYLSDRLQDGVGPKACNDDLKRLHWLLNLAQRDGLIPQNPFGGWKKLKEPAPKTRWLTEDEERALLSVVDEEFGRLIRIAILSGMRQAEQLTCTRSQILWESSEIYLPETKNGDARHIPMSDELRQLVETQLALGSDWLCPNRGRTNKWLKDNLRRYFDKACERAGVENATWHTLRHTFCSRLAMAGVPLRTIQILAGHKSITTTERYAHLSQDHLAESVKKLDRDDTRDDTRLREARR